MKPLKKIELNSGDDASLRHARLQCENGLAHVLLPKDAVSGIGCDEFLWSRTLRSYTEQAFTCVSGLIANSMLNRMLHRNSDIDSIKLRTMTDMVEREGSKIIGDMREYGFRILKEHGWNPETGLPEENAFIEPGIPERTVIHLQTAARKRMKENTGKR